MWLLFFKVITAHVMFFLKWKEGNVLFNNALNHFIYLYGIRDDKGPCN